MNFLERIKLRCSSNDDPLDRLSNWIAENPSRCSARSNIFNKSWLPHYSNSREALVIIFLSFFLPPWNSWEIRDRIKESCYYQRYEGDWNKVQLLLEQVTDLSSFEDWLQRNLSFDDFFGNFLREANRILRRNPRGFQDLVRDEKVPRRKIRHRGYRDKGSLRPYDKRGRNVGESSKGEDRRDKVQMKYLSFNGKLEGENLSTQERFGQDNSVQKGEKRNGSI